MILASIPVAPSPLSAKGAPHTSPGRQPRVPAITLPEPCRGETSAARFVRSLFRPFRAGIFILLKPGAVARGWYGSPRWGFFCHA